MRRESRLAARRAALAVALAFSLCTAGQVVSPSAARAQVVTRTGATKVAVGQTDACAIISGAAWCWGANYNGEVGDGTSTPREEPVAVETENTPMADKTLVQITAGNGFACALDSAGVAYCWGSNADGRLGCGNGPAPCPYVGSPSSVPVGVQMPAGHRFTTISAASTGTHVCALDEAGDAWCWGSNTYGQRGCGSTCGTGYVPVAVAMPSATTFTQIAVGDNSTCALDSAGRAWCWGSNSNGQLGCGATTGCPATGSSSGVPVAVDMPPVRAFTQIAVGGNHTCALNEVGKAYCWGDNSRGQLGGITGVATGARVLGRLSNAVKLSGTGNEWVDMPAAVGTAMSHLTNFTISAWVNPAATTARQQSRLFDFSNAAGGPQSGGATPGTRLYMYLTVSSNAAGNPVRFGITDNSSASNGGSPQEIDAPGSLLPLNTWTHVAVTESGPYPAGVGCPPAGRPMPTGGCYTGTLYLNGVAVASNPNMTLTPSSLGAITQSWIGRSPWAPLYNDPYLAATVDDFQIYNYALPATGAGTTIASLASGQPGDGNIADYKFDEFTGATALNSASGGGNATINSAASPSAASNIPVAVNLSGVAGSTLTQITTGANSTCALNTDGKAYCWGDNTSYQVGCGNSCPNPATTPVAVSTSPTDTTSELPAAAVLTDIDVGFRMACGMDEAGGVYCWGTNGPPGSIGRAATTYSSVPLLIIFPGEVTTPPGELTITAPEAAPESLSSATPGGIATGQLGQVTVTDDRTGDGAGSWVATVAVTNFTDGAGADISAEHVTYTIYDTLTYTGTEPTILNDADAEPPGGTSFGEAGTGALPGNGVAVLRGSGTSDATWDPWISVAVPYGAQAGTYTGTIYHSVA